jgi:hypothetical protein
MNLLEQMKEFDPKRNPAFTAIDKLKNPQDIQRFMREYEEWMVKNGDESIKGREVEVARSNIGYILGYYSDATAKLWYGSLPDVVHPVFGAGFGRGQEITPEEAFAKGMEMGKKWKENERGG